jgi:hypothetical protein
MIFKLPIETTLQKLFKSRRYWWRHKLLLMIGGPKSLLLQTPMVSQEISNWRHFLSNLLQELAIAKGKTTFEKCDNWFDNIQENAVDRDFKKNQRFIGTDSLSNYRCSWFISDFVWRKPVAAILIYTALRRKWRVLLFQNLENLDRLKVVQLPKDIFWKNTWALNKKKPGSLSLAIQPNIK